MQRMLKHTIKPVPGISKVSVRAGATILSVALQDGMVALWALEPVKFSHDEVVVIELCETGRRIDRPDDMNSMMEDCRRFLGTLLLDEGRYVLHAFQRDRYVDPES